MVLTKHQPPSAGIEKQQLTTPHRKDPPRRVTPHFEEAARSRFIIPAKRSGSVEMAVQVL